MNALVNFKEKRSKCPSRHGSECTSSVVGAYHVGNVEIGLIYQDCKPDTCPFMHWLDLIDVTGKNVNV